MPFFSRGGVGGASSASGSAPPSPTMSAHTTATNVGLSSAKLPEQLINRADLRNSISAYETLLTASKAYTQALISLGAASSQLATSLETCSRLKGAHKVGSGLLASSGVHHMASNSWSILADTFWKDASIPLMEHHDLYVTACAERSLQHEKSITEKARALNQAEKRNQRESRSKIGRDLHSFRRALNELQRHVDDLDEEKARYYADVLEGEEECWSFVQEKAIASLRNQLDMFERISSKGLSDPVLEPLLSRIEDPFSAYGPPRNDDQIYSILHHGTLLGLTTNGGDVSHGSDTPAADTTAEAITTADTSAGTNNGEGVPTMLPSNLIMSPSTPSKGLSRVTSGAASPKLSNEAVTGSGAKTPSNGLGISLAAAVELARNAAGSSPPQLKEAAKIETKAAQTQRDLLVEQNAELFGTDGEDDGGDEASIFSGTEDDLESSVTGTLQADGKAGARQATVGMAAKIMQEKKRRRENAVRANAKTRLKNALSTIDESKAPNAALAIIDDGNDADKTITKEDSQSNRPLSERDINSGSTDVDSHASEKATPQSSQIRSQEHDVDSVW